MHYPPPIGCILYSKPQIIIKMLLSCCFLYISTVRFRILIELYKRHRAIYYSELFSGSEWHWTLFPGLPFLNFPGLLVSQLLIIRSLILRLTFQYAFFQRDPYQRKQIYFSLSFHVPLSIWVVDGQKIEIEVFWTFPLFSSDAWDYLGQMTGTARLSIFLA